jgi:signal transduction histidine kinase
MDERGIVEEPVIIFLTLGFLLFAGFIILFIILHRQKVNRYLQEKILMETQFTEALLRSQVEIQEQTLRHISWELHDNLSQAASLIKINLFTLQLDDPQRALQKIEDTKDLTRQLISDLKALSVSLGSDRIEQKGLPAALETEIERLNKTGVVHASFKQEGERPELDNAKSVILYRMAQESLNNSIKHSGATHLELLLKVNGNLFTLAISDNGSGFNVEERKAAGGSGLLNLHNRARLINASLFLESAPGKGTCITIEMPL